MEWIMRRRQVFLLRRLARRMLRRDPRVTTEPNLRGKVMRTSKRSVIIAGAQTSVSLEDEFWEALKEIANERGTRVSDLVKSIKGLPTCHRPCGCSCWGIIKTKFSYSRNKHDNLAQIWFFAVPD
jgi:hypothetical protein